MFRAVAHLAGCWSLFWLVTTAGSMSEVLLSAALDLLDGESLLATVLSKLRFVERGRFN